MKTIKYMNYDLTMLVTGDENDKANVEYFVNGLEINDWGKLKPDFQELLNTLADVVCKKLSLTKWSY